MTYTQAFAKEFDMTEQQAEMASYAYSHGFNAEQCIEMAHKDGFELTDNQVYWIKWAWEAMMFASHMDMKYGVKPG